MRKSKKKFCLFLAACRLRFIFRFQHKCVERKCIPLPNVLYLYLDEYYGGMNMIQLMRQ